MKHLHIDWVLTANVLWVQTDIKRQSSGATGTGLLDPSATAAGVAQVERPRSVMTEPGRERQPAQPAGSPLGRACA
jgi:hypothetical protein